MSYDIRNDKTIIIFDKYVFLSECEYFPLKNLLIPIFYMLKILSQTLAYRFNEPEKLMFFKIFSRGNSTLYLILKCPFIRMLKYPKIDFSI